ncbi:DNA alkylation repair protein [Aureibacillus halotolerans]|uniref:DNA-3-methylpurine glycosylase n=1 Tax=Aureibacillus halotolerans TaxID=1508390 RepID=A0A4R6UB94_9BACI|nr:DNA-3-methylpurine glycosylase [Aureibacillus halotolerans]
MSSPTALKHYFDEKLATRIAELIKPLDQQFPADSFIERVAKAVGPFELKKRVEVIADELYRALPEDYEQALSILMHILGPENQSEKGMFTEGYFLMPITFFVEKYGVHDFEGSMTALYKMTKRHTSEYAVRPFINAYESDCLQLFEKWRKDPNAHVRRLVSEGTRPRLPWAKKINVLGGDPANNLSLLAPLFHDSSPYVRKSVANHVNDLSKEHRALVLDYIEARLENEGEHGIQTARHALRTLTKVEDKGAIALLKNFQKEGAALK